MQETSIRIGNSTYATENGSYGLTTLLNKHVKVKGSTVQFQFKGKSGVAHDAELENQRISQVIKHCQELPGEELFCYLDDTGKPRDTTSSDVNEYLKDIAGVAITAKDFRTWVGTVKALEAIAQCGPLEKPSARAFKQRQVDIIKKVSAELRNTVAVCRKYYVHPLVFQSDEKGLICELLQKSNDQKKRTHLSAHETLLMTLLEKIISITPLTPFLRSISQKSTFNPGSLW